MSRSWPTEWVIHAWPELGEWERWMHYALTGGGKHLRPRLAWTTYELYAEAPTWEEALPALRAIEQLHNFTLVHDDVMDDSPLRRGRPTLYKLTDANTAILIGDALLIAAYESLAALPPQKVGPIVRYLSRQALRVCHGQLLDMMLAQQPTAAVSIEAYYQMITEKTGALMGASLAIGGLLAQVAPDLVAQLQAAGEALGVFFQLQDDYLDAFSTQSGKKLGGDIAEGKKTFLWLWAYEVAPPAIRSRMEDASDPEARRLEVLRFYQEAGLKERAARFLAEAWATVEAAFDQLPAGAQLLSAFADLTARQA